MTIVMDLFYLFHECTNIATLSSTRRNCKHRLQQTTVQISMPQQQIIVDLVVCLVLFSPTDATGVSVYSPYVETVRT